MDVARTGFRWRACWAAAAVLLLALISAPLAEAAFPGKPGRIAYRGSLPGTNQSAGGTIDRGGDIFSVNPDGSDRRQLTVNGAEPDDDRSPAWSPDGSLIAYDAAAPFTPPSISRPDSTIYLMSADGSGQQALIDGSGPVFSADGLRLFSTLIDIDLLFSRVRSVNLDGSDLRQEPRTALDNYGGHVSPDGRFKVYVRPQVVNAPPDIFISRINGSQERQITNTPSGYEFSPVFAPDGSAIAYSTGLYSTGLTGDITDQSMIVTLDLASGATRIVSDPSIPSFQPDWGPIPVNCRNKRATLVGTPGNDTLKGTDGRDVLTGLGGNDKLVGLKGRDTLCGGPGKDKLVGGKGRDKLVQGG